MLKATRGKLLVLGFNSKEIEHLKQGNPLRINLKDLTDVDAQVIVFMGATDEEMKKKFERSGLADPHKGAIDLSKVKI